MNRRGLSLLELMAAGALLLMAAAVATPAMRAARERAQIAACADNLRHLGRGLLAYMADWEAPPTRVEQLRPAYILTRRGLECPPRREEEGLPAPGSRATNVSYVDGWPLTEPGARLWLSTRPGAAFTACALHGPRAGHRRWPYDGRVIRLHFDGSAAQAWMREIEVPGIYDWRAVCDEEMPAWLWKTRPVPRSNASPSRRPSAAPSRR